MLNKKRFISTVCIFFFLLIYCGGEAFAQSSFWGKGIGKLLKKADDYLEYSQMQGVDSNYIGRPDLNRQLYVGTYGYWQHYDLHFPYDDSMDGVRTVKEGSYYDVNMHAIQAEMELGIDYKGLAIELPIPLHNLYNFSLGLAKNGSVWGFRIRYKYMRHMNGSIENTGIRVDTIPDNLNNLKNFFVEGYYVFNNKRFSLAAGLYSDMIQKRSQGGAFVMGNFSRSIYTGEELFHGAKEVFRTSQISVGGGYGYNLVMCNSHLVFHASLIPMFSLYQKVSHSIYDENDIKEELGIPRDYDYDRFYNSITGTPKFVVNGFARFATNYSWDRYLLSLLVNYRQYLYSNDRGFRTHSREGDAQINFCVRF